MSRSHFSTSKYINRMGFEIQAAHPYQYDFKVVLVLNRIGEPCQRIVFVYLFDSLRPINNLSVKQGRVFLG